MSGVLSSVLIAVGGIAMWIGLMEIALRLVRWRRRHAEDPPLSPKWVVQHAYDTEGDRRWK